MTSIACEVASWPGLPKTSSTASRTKPTCPPTTIPASSTTAIRAAMTRGVPTRFIGARPYRGSESAGPVRPDRSSDSEEATEGQSAAHRRDAHGHAQQDEREGGEADRVPGIDQVEVVLERIHDDRLAEEEEADGDPRPQQTADEPLDHEGPADEPVGRADEPHHLALPAAGVDRETDRVRDQQQ